MRRLARVVVKLTAEMLLPSTVVCLWRAGRTAGEESFLWQACGTVLLVLSSVRICCLILQEKRAQARLWALPRVRLRPPRHARPLPGVRHGSGRG
jgi:hypothetical protein